MMHTHTHKLQVALWLTCEMLPLRARLKTAANHLAHEYEYKKQKLHITAREKRNTPEEEKNWTN